MPRVKESRQTTDKAELGRVISEALEKKGLKAGNMARELRINATQLSRVLKGERGLTPQKARLVGEFLGIIDQIEALYLPGVIGGKDFKDPQEAPLFVVGEFLQKLGEQYVAHDDIMRACKSPKMLRFIAKLIKQLASAEAKGGSYDIIVIK